MAYQLCRCDASGIRFIDNLQEKSKLACWHDVLARKHAEGVGGAASRGACERDERQVLSALVIRHLEFLRWSTMR